MGAAGVKGVASHVDKQWQPEVPGGRGLVLVVALLRILLDPAKCASLCGVQ